MEEYNRYVRIADGDPVKLARMLEIQSQFDNKDQLAATTTSMAKYLQQSEKAVILPKGVVREYIELLLQAMEQTNSPNPIVREGWCEYQSQMEHPPEIEGSSIYTVPFVSVSWQSEPVESLSTKPNCQRRKPVRATMLPAILSLAVYLIPRGSYLPPNSMRRSIGLSILAGYVLSFRFESTFRYECLLNFRFAVLSI